MANLSDFGFSIPETPEERPDTSISAPKPTIVSGKSLGDMGFSLADQPQISAAAETQRTGLGSLARGAVHGLTAGWADELRGLAAASGYAEAMPYLPEEQQPKSLEEAGKQVRDIYEQQRELERKAYRESYTQHPYLTGTGEITGAIGSLAAAPLAAPAKLPAALSQAAKIGATYGAISGAGAGEDVAGTIGGAGLGAGLGAVGAPLGVLAGKLAGIPVGYLWDKLGRPIANAARGLRSEGAEKAAAEAVYRAYATDQERIAAGQAMGFSPQQWDRLHQLGMPVTLAERGADATRALLRSAANISPEAEGIINATVQPRYKQQSERAAEFLRQMVGGANATKARAQNQAEYDLARGPAYKAAFSHPNAAAVWDEGFEQFMQSPSVQSAARLAMYTAKEDAAKLGLNAPKNPFVLNKDGRIVLRQVDPQDPNSVMKPSLQFWDSVKKNLDQIGRRDPEAQQWARILRNRLDEIVPPYKNARGIAETYFDAGDAIEAGEKAAAWKKDPSELRQIMGKFNPAEKALFQEGFLSQAAQRIQNLGDKTDVTGRLFSSPQERKVFETVMGPRGSKMVENYVYAERVIDQARRAMGNSTTAKQMIAAGLAGGGVDYFIHGNPMEAFGAGLGAAGLAKGVGTAVAQRIVNRLSQNTANRIAEMLMSDDPRVYQRGQEIVMKNAKVANAFRELNDRIARASGARGNVGSFQFPAVVGAEPNQQNIPGPPAQQHYGGKVENKNGFAHGGRVWHKKLDHKSVGYVARSRRQEHCAACSMFIAKGGPACTLVKSPINPAGWCRRFVKKKLSMADGGNVGDASEWEALPHTPEGIPQITVPPPQNPMMTQGMGDIVRGVGSALASPITDAYKLATGKVMPEEVPWTTAMALGSIIGPPGEAQAVGAAERVAPKFYSALEQAVGKIPQARMPAEQWMGTLANKPGVRPDELAWTGLQDFLTTKKGQPVSKQEMLDYLANNKITVQEVTKSGPNRLSSSQILERARSLADDAGDHWDELGPNGRQMYEDIARGEIESEGGAAKFSQWQLPGGTNYREKLLTLPEQSPTVKRMQDIQKRLWEISNLPAAVHKGPEGPALLAEFDALQSEKTRLKGEIPPTFKSPHWDEPNVLAHYRMNDRMVEAPGDNVPKESLHLEELQSDWHQQGRKRGYASELPELKTQLENLKQGHERVYTDKVAFQLKGDDAGAEAAKARQLDIIDRMNALHDKIRETESGVPDAPFKKNWHELALKSAVRDAIESGKDRVSWTPGEAQAERYDLSKHVTLIHYNQKSGLLEGYNGPDRVLSKTVQPENLGDYIGKEAADRLMKKKPITVDSDIRELSGVDLKVGGEGMKGFYDQMLPKAVEKIFKEYGVKVKKGSVPGEKYKGYVDYEYGEGHFGPSVYGIMPNGERRIIDESFRTKQDAMAELKKLKTQKTEGQPVWYFDIPQALKNASLQKGHPLFAKGGRVKPKVEIRPLRIPKSLSAIQAVLKATRKT